MCINKERERKKKKMAPHPFKCDPEAYKEHYCAIGGNKSAYAHQPYFKGAYIQRGYGNIFGVLKRGIVPLIKTFVKSRAGRELGKDVLMTGTKVFKDAVTGKRGFKRAVKKHSSDAIRKRVESFLKSEGAQRGGGSKRRRVVDILGD